MTPTAPATVPAHRNPFRVERQHALRFRFPPGDDLGALLDRLKARGGRGAIFGPHGSGKTTLLGELADRLRRAGIDVRALRIGRGQRALPRRTGAPLLDDLGPDHAVLLDGAGHLAPWHWWAFGRRVRAAGIVVITAHRAGRLPTLLRTATTPALLCELCGQLGAPIDDARAAALWDVHRGDVRAALRELYDLHHAPDPRPPPNGHAPAPDPVLRADRHRL